MHYRPPSDFLMPDWQAHHTDPKLNARVVSEQLSITSSVLPTVQQQASHAWDTAMEVRRFMDFCAQYHPMVFADWKKFQETERYMDTGTK